MDQLEGIRNSLQDALDELSSPRSSLDAKSHALYRIEERLARACVAKDAEEELHFFNALQYTFECNVPLRLLAWISTTTSLLEAVTNKGSLDADGRESQTSQLASQLSLGLSLLQGVSLNHSASKTFLGRKYALEVLIDLLLASRHLPTATSSVSNAPAAPVLAPLSSVILDTLLCVLVDSAVALRAFEESNGIQAIVKILKRAGTPREVRMKCLEFLYFYLLDERPSSQDSRNSSTSVSVPTPPPTAPATPYKHRKTYLSSKPLWPSSRLASSELSISLTEGSSTSLDTPRSSSGSSTNSFTSSSSSASNSTAPSSISSSLENVSSMRPPKTPPSSPPLPHRLPQYLQPRSLMMLRKEFDYEPQSPRKRAGVGGSRHTPSRSTSRFKLSEDDCQRYDQVLAPPLIPEPDMQRVLDEGVMSNGTHRVKTTEEKKEFLGTMLGNVDALVDGVRKAGIWGLG